MLLAANVMIDTGGDIALAAVKVIVGFSLACVPVAIQFGIWTLQNEANESLIDPLTGLLNRRGVRLHLRNLLSRKGSGDDHIVVMVVDLDRFKDINEVHGHGVGDEVLVRSARRIQLAAAPQSVVARVGGEEFVVIAVLAATAVARAADLVCAAVYSATDAVPVTGSVGVASTTMTTSGDKPAVSARMWEALLDCADHAMFDAKRAGGVTGRCTCPRNTGSRWRRRCIRSRRRRWSNPLSHNVEDDPVPLRGGSGFANGPGSRVTVEGMDVHALAFEWTDTNRHWLIEVPVRVVVYTAVALLLRYVAHRMIDRASGQNRKGDTPPQGKPTLLGNLRGRMPAAADPPKTAERRLSGRRRSARC